MVGLAGWILTFIIFYILFKMMLKLISYFQGAHSANRNGKPGKPERFDTDNKDITDADYKEIK
jgi:hypothetical protein